MISNSRNGSALSAYSSASVRLDPRAMINHTEHLQNYISSKSILQLQEKSDLEVQSAKSTVEEILRREKTVVKDCVDPLIEEHIISGHRRREALNKRWNRAVFEPALDQVSRSIQSAGGLEFMRNKRQCLHQDYLDYVNRKSFVSLNAYCADEYYPFALRQTTANLQRLRPPVTHTGLVRAQSANPTSVDALSRLAEDNVQIRCLTGLEMDRSGLQQLRLPRTPLVPLGRKDSGCISWSYMPYYQINSDVRHRCRKNVHGDFNDASAQFCFVNHDAANRMELHNKNMRLGNRDLDNHTAIEMGTN